jgi:hypothetical protein
VRARVHMHLLTDNTCLLRFLQLCMCAFWTFGATMATVNEPSEALLKVAKGSFRFTTSVYKVSDSCLNYGNVEGCKNRILIFYLEYFFQVYSG